MHLSVKTFSLSIQLPVLKSVIETPVIASSFDMVTTANVQGDTSIVVRFFPHPGKNLQEVKSLMDKIDNLLSSVQAIGGNGFYCHVEDKFVLDIPTSIVGKSLIIATR